MRNRMFSSALIGLTALWGCYSGGTEIAQQIRWQYMEARAWLRDTLTPVEPEKNPPALEEIVENVAAENRLPPVLIAALIVQESGAGMRQDRVRYEAHLQPKFKREGWMTDAEYKALASSWGLGQVIYGLHRQRCNLHSYADLLQPETNLRCAARILSECLRRRTSEKRLDQCLSEYNGDDTGRYSAQVMGRMARLALEASYAQ
jgi:hypothetical protein